MRRSLCYMLFIFTIGLVSCLTDDSLDEVSFDCGEGPVLDCTGCEQVEEPVCGCDGVTYQNECIANCSGIFFYTEGVCD